MLYERIDKNGNVIRFRFSKEDISIIDKHKWFIDNVGYATTIIDRLPIRLHKILITSGIVDHISGDKLDNTRANLRVVTKSQNSMNVGLRLSNKSGATGVFKVKNRLKWIAYINILGKRKNLGTFKCPILAIHARKVAEKKYFGDYRRL